LRDAVLRALLRLSALRLRHPIQPPVVCGETSTSSMKLGFRRSPTVRDRSLTPISVLFRLRRYTKPVASTPERLSTCVTRKGRDVSLDVFPTSSPCQVALQSMGGQLISRSRNGSQLPANCLLSPRCLLLPRILIYSARLAALPNPPMRSGKRCTSTLTTRIREAC
jgi:hypothetical protein